ncbi:unnamed protein product [Parascedosporium putredinis]|uniref:Chromo domain-containing protein n=1 Tax=Parascedosporium putredinis TaxID=1442378 RepID=A0A9P1GXW0_9PEZI|nr:unnamed protein product [Parascedosporium putredinis]CAI7990104.1 unnamed protein product [Parascedosporium putredinis]
MSPIAPPSSSVGNDNKQASSGVRTTLRWLGVNAPQTQQQQEEHVAPDKTAAPPQPTQHKIHSITATPPKPKAFVTALRAPQTEPKPRSAPPAAASSTDENGGSITVSGSQPVAPVSRARYSMAAVSSIFSRAPSSVQAQKTETMVEVARPPRGRNQAKASDDDDGGEDSDEEEDAEEADEEATREREPDRDGEAPSSPASGRKPAPGYHESARTRVVGAKTNGATTTTAPAAPQPTARRGRSDRQSAKAKDTAAAATTSAVDAGAGADSDLESDSESVTDASKFEISQLVNHRPSKDGENLFELQVLWYHPEDAEAEDVTWEPEDVIHRDAPTLLFAYWRSLKGGREAQMDDPDLWVSLHVSWIGSPQATWEPEANVEESSPEAVAEYWAAKGGRDRVISGATAKKRGLRVVEVEGVAVARARG